MERNVSKVTICFSGETPGDIYCPIDWDSRGDFKSHSKGVFVNSGVDDFHRRLVSGVAVTATIVSAILTVNRDHKREISLAVSSEDRKYRADRISAQIVEDIISK